MHMLWEPPLYHNTITINMLWPQTYLLHDAESLAYPVATKKLLRMDTHTKATRLASGNGTQPAEQLIITANMLTTNLLRLSAVPPAICRGTRSGCSLKHVASHFALCKLHRLSKCQQACRKMITCGTTVEFPMHTSMLLSQHAALEHPETPGVTRGVFCKIMC
jgi:hypothetical protein